MAEIQFERRGTPLWLVLLILLLVGAGAYFAFGRRPEAPVTAARADSAQAPAVAPAPGAAPAAPAAPSGPSAEFARFVDAGAFPAAATAQRTYLTDATRKMAAVLQERAPAAGVQTVMLRAVADTIAMASTTPARVAELTQLAMFAFAHALTSAKVDDGRLAPAASAVQLGVPLTQQTQQVNDYLKAARDVLRGGAPAGGAAPGAAPTPRP